MTTFITGIRHEDHYRQLLTRNDTKNFLRGERAFSYYCGVGAPAGCCSTVVYSYPSTSDSKVAKPVRPWTRSGGLRLPVHVIIVLLHFSTSTVRDHRLIVSIATTLTL
ncbi:hypothetical protein EVAR_90291_1 [Eumeta japonica]|uniref:Uncharacterized protein n=1 Tax=Eumeta variegata TaxID=151549 RepID=A0A4C1Z3F7_EUMVA|nr:hypothetical protein EVAR_90291_1 [Eumeta japonica]